MRAVAAALEGPAPTIRAVVAAPAPHPRPWETTKWHLWRRGSGVRPWLFAIDVPNVLGASQAQVDEKIRALLPNYMAMGETGMHDMTEMQMNGPRNTLPMMAGAGPFGPIGMGGMFTRPQCARSDHAGGGGRLVRESTRYRGASGQRRAVPANTGPLTRSRPLEVDLSRGPPVSAAHARRRRLPRAAVQPPGLNPAPTGTAATCGAETAPVSKALTSFARIMYTPSATIIATIMTPITIHIGPM